jgi:outer membrane protein assembly factor BamB
MAVLSDGSLLVVNSYVEDSRILHFSNCSSTGLRQFIQNITSFHPLANGGLVHPYGLAVLNDGVIFTSSQDSGAVQRFFGPMAPVLEWAGQPYPFPATVLQALASGQDAYPGAFAFWSTSTSSLRGIAISSTGSVYVADEASGMVRVLNSDGSASTQYPVTTPIGLLLDEPTGRLFVSSNSGPVYALRLSNGEVLTKYTSNEVSHSTGMALYGSKLYVLSQNTQTLVAFDANSGAFLGTLAQFTDAPEQMLLVSC